ncbi:alpha 1,2-mannosyltransferase 2.4.1 [Pleurotus pulmonarius]|nr:alpha 1,2-mannosyltransferase 2.4.1 [Pleurotus pulmonarius]
MLRPVALPAALATSPHNLPAYGAMDTQLTASELQIQNNVKSYLSLAAVTILYYDYWLTLPLEIERYWALKGFTTARFLFYLNRYTSLLAHVPVIVAYFWTDDPFNKVDVRRYALSIPCTVVSQKRPDVRETIAACHHFHSFHSYYIVAAQLIIGLILTIRTYALYAHNRKFLYIMCPVIAGLVALGSWAIASSDDGHSNPDALQVQAWPRIGCIESLTHTGGIHLAIAWACLLVFDISIYILTLRKAFGSHRVPGKSLVQTILRDASVYIAVILVINMSIVLTLALAPAALKGVSTTFSSWMNIGARYLLLVVGAVVCIHYIISFTHEEYGRITSINNIASHFRPAATTVPDALETGDVRIPVQNDLPSTHAPTPPRPPKSAATAATAAPPRANATLLILAKYADVDNLVPTIRDIEDRFNKHHNYPYVILNPEAEFGDDFKKRISVLTKAKIEYGVVPKELWDQPEWIDKEKAAKTRDQMDKDGIVFGGSLYHRNLWRFRAGFFFKHPLLQQYRWYWWIDPGTRYHCNMGDPFLFMEQNNKTFGFTMTLYEFGSTIPTLWGHVRDYMGEHPEYIAQDNAMDYLSDNGGETYNRCHFWSNFQIADMGMWRGEAYQSFFDYLDKKGGFYYERWADAPIHSIGAALFSQKDQIHFFDDIGYENNPYIHCTQNATLWETSKCGCDPKRNFDYDGYSCMKQWERIHS